MMQIIADNIQITQNRIASAIEKQNPEPIVKLVNECISAGAQGFDLNTGPLKRNPKQMAFLVETVQNITPLPLLLDTTNPFALEAGLQVGKNPMIINGFSLEPDKIEYILPLAKKYQVDIIGYLLYPNSQVPATADERMNIAVSVYTEFKNAGLDDEQLIIDPIVAPALWQDGIRQDVETLSLIKQLPDLLGFPVRTIAGLSNLTTGKGPALQKGLLEQTYLCMLAGSGLNMILMNALHSHAVQLAKACWIFRNPGIFSWEQVLFR